MKRIILFFFLALSLIIKGQSPYEFNFYPTNSSATFYGTLELNGNVADSLDWIAAFDSSGNCAGTSQVLMYNGISYINLVIYGDDPLTPLIDEGISGNEDFYLKVWVASSDDILPYQSTSNIVSFSGWINTNGAPIPSYNNPNTIYNFEFIEGCTDSIAFNYNANANVDDGSCVAVVPGCTDATAFNYNTNANVDDGSCIAVINGCTDATAFNYNINANIDDSSCVAVLNGCTDTLAINYNPSANTDDSSCIILGCTDSTALNYNPIANLLDSSCAYSCQQLGDANCDNIVNLSDLTLVINHWLQFTVVGTD